MKIIEKIDTCGVKYIGSKKKLLESIGTYVKNLPVKTALDVFTGTTRVAQFLRQLDIKCNTSDLSWASKCYANTFVHNGKNEHLQKYVDKLNALEGIDGWLTKNYSGAGNVSDPKADGRCWQPKNSRRADAAREFVKKLYKKGEINEWENDTLVTSIIFALDAVDNTVGVQQAYLKSWCERSKKDISFALPAYIEGPIGTHQTGNALALDYEPVDLAYLDPPYSPHSYATYYHIWDSIAEWDTPETDLKARRRIDRVSGSKEYDKTMESKWNLRNEAINAFEELLSRLRAKYIMISYNDESIVDQDKLRNLCEKYDIHGEPEIHEITYRRNIMSQIGNAQRGVINPEDAPKKGQKNKELLIIINKC